MGGWERRCLGGGRWRGGWSMSLRCGRGRGRGEGESVDVGFLMCVGLRRVRWTAVMCYCGHG